MLAATWQDGVPELIRHRQLTKDFCTGSSQEQPFDHTNSKAAAEALQDRNRNPDRARIQMIASSQNSLMSGLIIPGWTVDDWAIDPTTAINQTGEPATNINEYTPCEIGRLWANLIAASRGLRRAQRRAGRLPVTVNSMS